MKHKRILKFFLYTIIIFSIYFIYFFANDLTCKDLKILSKKNDTATTYTTTTCTSKPVTTTLKPTPAPTITPTSSIGVKLGLSKNVATTIAEVLELVNKERAKKGLSALTTNIELTKCATIRSKELITLFDHTRPDGTTCFSVLNENNVSYGTCGENIAAGYPNAASVVEGWMNSEGHRKNILNGDFKKMGVGLVISNKGYGYFWTQIFTN